MLQLLRQSTRAARAATPSRWIERTPGRLSSHLPVCSEISRRGFSHDTSYRQETPVASPTAGLDQGLPPPTKPDKKRLEWKKVPVVCPGCGAHSQTVDQTSAGYYGEKRRKRDAKQMRQKEEDEVFQQALQSGSIDGASAPAAEVKAAPRSDTVSMCDRCHNLHHNGVGNSIIHPSMQSIQAIIEESPHKHNHIYHVLDAADFPMSLIPNLQTALELPRLRTQNRRSRSMRYIRGRVAEVSFIITRSDLLAPQKEQVDSLMPYLQECLRDALGRSGKKLRLGNVRCVSAKRSWWTKTVKEDIWNRGGAGWMVGKVNVGKSALFEAAYPKGRGAEVKLDKLRHEESKKAGAANANALADGVDDALSQAYPEHVGKGEERKNGSDDEEAATFKDTMDNALARAFPEHTAKTTVERLEPYQETEIEIDEDMKADEQDESFFDEDEDSSLLPPAQPETKYPQMPLVSSLPGTTASPIRLPFGGGKGELIDLPGIHRSSLDEHVTNEHKSYLVMQTRVTPEQHTVKPGQSLLLGGLIRVTPKTDDLIMLMYPFTPDSLNPHVTNTEKAIAIQTGIHSGTGEPYAGTVPSIATEAAKQSIASAGSFKLAWNVTKRRAGPVTSSSAGKQKPDNLPYVVYSADLLIEGVGWVELVAQVRRTSRMSVTETITDDWGEDTRTTEIATVPEVEVFSPKGQFVGLRRPMNAWLLGGKKKVPVHERKSRGRMSVSFRRRQAGGAGGVKG